MPPQPLQSPLLRRSELLAEALKQQSQPQDIKGGWGELAARLLAQGITGTAARRTDEALANEQYNETLNRRRAMFPGLSIEGEAREVGNGRYDPIAGIVDALRGKREQPQAAQSEPAMPSQMPQPAFMPNNTQEPQVSPVAPVGPVDGAPLPMQGQSPIPAPAMPQQAPQQSQIPPQVAQQINSLLAVGTPEAEDQALKLYQGWQQQQQILASIPPELRNDPKFMFAAQNNPQALAESLGYQYRPQVIAAGGVQSVIGSGDRVSAPQTMQFGDTLTRVDPLSPDPQVIAQRGPTYSEQTARIAAQQPEPVTVGPGEALYSFGPEGTAAPLAERAPTERPLSASEQNAIDALEIETTFTRNALGNVRGVISNIDAGRFNLDPVSRASYEARNRTGNASPESLAYANAWTTVNNLRNTLLRQNKGTQTEGDAIRTLEEVIAGWGDENVMRQGLAQFEQLYGGVLQAQEGQLTRRRSGEARQVGGSAASGPRVGTVEDGYEFLGGDPSSPSSWRRVR